MSILADTTEEKVIAALSECVILFEKLHYLKMTAADDFDAATAERLLKRIIESNGFKVDYTRNKKLHYSKLK